VSQRIEFGSKAAADSFRDEYDQWVCPVDDDRRLKTVAFKSDTPESVIERAEIEAAAGRGERESDGKQVPLTESERDRLDFGKESVNVPWARSIKGIARSEGVDDWLAHVDSSLTVDEHRDIMQRAAREDRGQRLDAEESADEKLQRAEGGQCEHARGHCENGARDACEFLKEACDYSEDEVAAILGEDDRDTSTQQQLVTVGGDGGEFEPMEVPPEQAGALARSWHGYRNAVGRLSRELDDVRDAVTDARQAWRAINAIRTDHGQEDLHPNDLHDLLNALAGMPESIPETRTLDHFGDRGDDPDSADRREVLDVEHQQQVGLDGERQQQEQQAQIATETDVREAQSQESRQAVEETSEFGVDDRSDPSRGDDPQERTEQQQFRDPEQDRL
jgi:hypothetical protein